MIDKDVEDLLHNFIYDEKGALLRVYKFGKECLPYISYKSKNNSGYYSVRINKTTKVSVHVAVWAYHNKRWPRKGMQIDHIDRNKENNKIENLRELSIEDQKQNLDIIKTNTSGIRNVCFHKGSGLWRICLMRNNKMVTKYFKSKQEAKENYDRIIDEYTPRANLQSRKDRGVLSGSGDER